LEQARQLIQEAEHRNPGPWVAHAHHVGEAARRIAEKLTSVNPSDAFILGLLHDIGRREGVSDMRHIIDGYRFLMSMGYEDAARISLTHSFPLQDVRAMSGNWDGTPQDEAFVDNYLRSITYTQYDRLIQLCDAICMAQGFVLIQKRMVDVALRRGINEQTLQKWRAFFAIQHDFEQEIGHSIYALLPGVVESTFGYETIPS
jgi:hypothetical protein